MPRQTQERQEFKGVTIGMPADNVLKVAGFSRANMVRAPKLIGKDEDGLVVEWHYRFVILTIARATQTEPVEETRYAVQKIEVRDIYVQSMADPDDNGLPKTREAM